VSLLSVLETFHQDSQAAGVKVGEDLRGQVRAAIETLANGFLQGPLAAELARQPDRVPEFYDEILHVIYRILFLLYAEQRAILPRREATLADLYREVYSLTALREPRPPPTRRAIPTATCGRACGRPSRWWPAARRRWA
jgi:hypothetical protein